MNKKRGRLDSNKKAQVTVFIIIAIIIIVGIVVYFALRGQIFVKEVPKELLPAYNYFLDCVKEETKQASSLMGSQAGYIETPDFEPGSAYMPFSSQLDFFSTSVPYWYYISGNGLVKEQIPSKQEMENQLSDYLAERILECNFNSFESQGFEIEFGDINNLDVSIKDNEVDVNIDMPMTISFGEVTSVINNHKIIADTRLGKFYNLARKIYDKEQENLFLENYGIDVLRLYAPVDGVEISCAPKIWLQSEIKSEFKQALESNVQAIKIKGSYYSLGKKQNSYFVQDIGEQIGATGENINLIYSQNWPTKISVYPDEEPLIAEPVGMQEGLGILGFCYVPYHFVYDVAYPVLIQIYDLEEVFQFPIGVVIDKNKPREGLKGAAVLDAEPEICKYKNQEIGVYTYNTELEPVESDIGFECIGQRCSIGKTEITGDGSDNDAYLAGLFPQCVNGYITARAEGYAKKRTLVSTNAESEINIILDKLYNNTVELQIDGALASEQNNYAVISFISEDNSQTIAWPQQKEIMLSEGQYDISVYVYRNSKITIPGIKKEQCSEVPKSGLLGLLGGTEEKCFNVDIPSYELTNVISGGGKNKDYLTEGQIENGKLKINVGSLPLPQNLEQLQDNYNLLETQTVDLEFG